MHPNYKIAFLTEMNFSGRVKFDHPNMRTEFAWMHALDANHFNIQQHQSVSEYDHVFIIFPKGRFNLNAVGEKIANIQNYTSDLLSKNIVSSLKENNGKVHIIQEGPHWMFNDLEIPDQINFYNMLVECDSVFAHNNIDVQYFLGLVPNKKVNVIPTLMIENLLDDVVWNPKDKSIIGGNFSRWYGGFESFIVAREFNNEIWGQTSHSKRENEDQLIRHLPRVLWIDWMKQLREFKYAVHLMSTVAAGTFSLNCSYFGIPCIGNIDVNTQRLCQPDLSVEVHNIPKALDLAKRLLEDNNFYEQCSEKAKKNYRELYSLDVWKNKIFSILNNK